MPRHIDPPISIAQRGLANYLNETKDKHNNHGYFEFTHHLKLKVPKRIIAEDFNVNTRTIYLWIKVYDKESILQ